MTAARKPARSIASPEIKLSYVNDSEPGIRRIKRGNKFIYEDENGPVKDPVILERIRKIVIPPAWENVWICSRENGHIQAVGYDLKHRKQYRYHPTWNEISNKTKFDRMLLFGERLNLLRRQLNRDLARERLCEEKVLATAISLMECTYIRMGSHEYTRLYGSYGLTTLQDGHVNIKGQAISLSFRGKKGVYQQLSVKNKKLACIIKQCREIPGKELFQYYDEEGHRHVIDSGKVNAYIKEVTGDGFTAKDFRTWAGTLNALRELRKTGMATDEKELKQKISATITEVSRKLGNTENVCRKYYIHPLVIECYKQGKLADTGAQKINSDEELLICLLKKQKKTRFI